MTDAPRSHRMSTPELLEPVRQKAGTPEDGPVMMLNINRYHPDAGFPNSDPYVDYLARLEATVGSVGGAVLWRSEVQGQIIGCDHDVYDEILAVWYPSRTVFLALSEAPGAAEMFAGRKACVANATILELPADQAPFHNSDPTAGGSA